MERIKAYTRPAPDGKGVIIDTNGMLVDLLTIYKADGQPLKTVLDDVAEVWSDLRVDVIIPDDQKN